MMKVLIVDDDALLLHMYQIKLAQSGYQVLTAENSEVAWHMIEKHRPDVVISDFVMPIGSGLELLKTIRASKAFERLPMVMMSNTASEQEYQTARELGANALFRKSEMTPSQLVKTVESVLSD